MDRGHSKYFDWLPDCYLQSASGVSTTWHTRKLPPESGDRADIHGNFPGPKLCASPDIQLDCCPHCGIKPFKEEQIHGHYLCVHCRTVTVGCCDGSA